MISRREALAAMAAAALVACKKSEGLRIAVIPKGTTHEFWKAVHAGASKAGSEAGATILWKGPLKEDDLSGQIQVVQSFTDQHVSGIVLAPLSDKGLVNPVKAAVDSKIPVVVFDSDLQGDAHASFVATDNYAAGKMAAAEMTRVLGGKGNVVVLRYQEGSASTSNRERGFVDGIKGSDIKIVSENQYGGATTETALAASESLLAAQKAASGGVQGVFAPNESTTFGMLRALENTALTGKVQLVGFDSSPKLVDATRSGAIAALVLQNPFNIGYLAVKTMAAVIRGEKVEKRIDTGAKLVSKANLDSPEVAELLKKWD
jgi:ribose transport system substrate-binding protein